MANSYAQPWSRAVIPGACAQRTLTCHSATWAAGDSGRRRQNQGPLWDTDTRQAGNHAKSDSKERDVELAADAGEPVDDATAQGRLESLLFLAKTPLSNRRLAQLAGLEDATRARTVVRQLNTKFATLGRGIRVESVAGGQRLMTHPAVAPWLGRLGHLPQPVRLSKPMLETLSVVAYRQDVTRADIEAIRGVACGELLRQLMQADLVRIAGRSEELGRPYLYGTTQRFLKICGLASINGLPPIDERVLDDDLAAFDTQTNESSQPLVPSDSIEMPPNSNGSGHLPTSSKESDVSVVVTEPNRDDVSVAIAFQPATNDTADAIAPHDPAVAVIEDEEDDLYENGLENDYDDEDDDWDDDFEDDDEEAEDSGDEEDDDYDGDGDEEDEDDDGEDDWQEVDGDDADEEWDEDEGDDDWDDDEDDDDEDWDEED